MSANISAQAGQSQIELFEIKSNYTKQNLSVLKGLTFHYYESILDHTIRATARLVDTGHRNTSNGGALVEDKDINLNVGEFAEVKVVDGLGNLLNFTGDNKLRILQTRDIEESVNKLVLTVDLTSVEYNDNLKEKCAVNKRYDGKIDETIRKVLREALKTKKTIDADATLNSFNILGRNQTPFHICSFLASRSVPDIENANGNLAGYFFYETANGYKFKSIDKLFQQRPKRILIYNELIEEAPPPEYDGKILVYSFDRTLNLKKLMETGALGQSKIRTFDVKPGNQYSESDFNYQNQFREKNTGGKEAPKYGDDQNETTKRYFQVKDYGHNPSGSIKQQLEKSKDIVNYDIDAIVRQAIMRYNGLFSIKLSVVIAGDISLRAGDLIHCDFPNISGNKLKTYSTKKSGIYMITDLCHRITKEGCYTSLNLVRDSIGRKSISR